MAKSAFRSLKGLVTLVSGGASGLGRATAERLVEHGGKVVICDLPTSTGQVVARSLGEDCIFSAADVSSEDQVKSALNVINAQFGRLDAVVNCAGVSVAFKIYNFLRDKPQDLSDMTKMLQANVNGTFNVNRLAVEMLSRNTPDADGQKGVIVNTSGISAFEGLIGQASFGASCHAITSATLPLARDLASQGIRCCTIATGFMKTELNSTLPEEVVHFIAESTPFPKRFGHPEEFAHLVQCILENPMLNGEVIRLDGGTRFNL